MSSVVADCLPVGFLLLLMMCICGCMIITVHSTTGECIIWISFQRLAESCDRQVGLSVVILVLAGVSLNCFLKPNFVLE